MDFECPICHGPVPLGTGLCPRCDAKNVPHDGRLGPDVKPAPEAAPQIPDGGSTPART